MSITATAHLSGWIEVTAVIDGFLVRRKYNGVSVKQAIRLFKQELSA
jgi:hypothetical protein